MKTKSVLPFRVIGGFLYENLANTGRSKKQLLMFAIDGAMVAFSIWAAFSLRIAEMYTFIENIDHLLIIMPPITVLVFASLGIYRWVVRSSSSRQIEQLIKGTMISAVVLLIVLYLFPITYGPRSTFFIYGLVLLTLTVGYRVLWARFHKGNFENTGKPIAIYGAGEAGRQLVSLMQLSRNYCPKLFLDDDVTLIGSTVSGINVYNPRAVNINHVLKRHEVVELVMAMPSISSDQYSRLIPSLNTLNIPLKTIPTLSEISSGRRSPDEIKNIDMGDLLGRDSVEPDIGLLQKTIRNKVVLITGSGGSIGSELSRQALKLGAAKIILLDHSESALYQIHQEILELNSEHKGTVSIVTALASINDWSSIDNVFKKHKPDTVYHAAAYKHVPMVETHPVEGVKTNIFGTRNVVLAAEKYRVQTFVLISTDKAVRPTNVMGATKSVAEQLLQSRAFLPGQRTRFCMVRFGNVLGSSGSVIPLFEKQIRRGGPLTVTHPEMTRYFMTISEAVSLVIQAGAMSEGGEIFLLDMGKPVKILDMAKAMIHLHGYTFQDSNRVFADQNKSIEISFVGIRPGEKLYEELLIDFDSSRKTQHPKIRTGHENYCNYDELQKLCLNPLIESVRKNDVKSIKKILSNSVVGYRNLTQ